MSVQAGIWNVDLRPLDQNLLINISQGIAEYGPDGEGTYFDNSLGMLYRAFHTTPESRLEHQPLVTATGEVMTWDGRLDNRDELLAELRDKVADDKTDISLVAAALGQWEEDGFAKLIGDWAVVIWNPHSRKLILARDYAGVRHLFYYRRPASVLWCTDLKTLASCGDQFNLCDEYFAGFLALWPDAHLTPYTEIRAVPPGHFVRISDACVSVQAYWEFNPRVATRYKTDREYEEHFRQLFRQAVQQRLRTDSPILADLSGGLDSSSIVCMADDIVAKEDIDMPSVDTFTALIRDEPGEEDSRYFAAVEKQRARIGHHVEICGVGDEWSYDYSNFFATPTLRPRPELTSAKDRTISQGNYRVVLSGTGGDEMLGQALDPRVQLADLLRKREVTKLVGCLSEWSLLLRRPWMDLFLDSFYLQLPNWIRLRRSELAELEPWVDRDFAGRHRLSERQLDVAEGRLSWLPSVRDWFQTVNVLARQLSAKHPAIAEIRYPYLDRRLVEFLTSIPTDQLLRPRQRRSLMRRALAGILPPEIVSRRTKASGARYFGAVLEKHWQEVDMATHTSELARHGYVRQHQFQSALRNAKHGKLSQFPIRLSKALGWEFWLREALAQGVIEQLPGSDIVSPTTRPTRSLLPRSFSTRISHTSHNDTDFVLQDSADRDADSKIERR